jgi:hypothetical protein
MTDLSLQTVARALGGAIIRNQVLAPGPGHSPSDRSLSIKLSADAPDGFIVHSFAHDDPILCKDYVRGKLGLSPFTPSSNGQRQAASEDTVAQALMAAVNTRQQAPRKQRATIEKAYDYLDEAGALLFQVVRYIPKDFRQRRPNGHGGWIANLEGVRRVPYRLPDLIKFPSATVFVCEGEKDADRLAALDLCATTVASSNWDGIDLEIFRGRDVIVLEDNDQPGRDKALTAAARLHGIACVRIVRLPDLPDKGDVSDWLDGDSRRASKLVEVCFDAPLWQPEASPQQQSARYSWSYHGGTAEASTAWLIKNILPQSGIGLIAGQWGAYKTTVALDIAISVMTEALFAGRFMVKRRGGVCYLALEGAGGLESRLDAIARTRSITGPLPFAWRSDCPPLVAPRAPNNLAVLLDEATQYLKQTFGVPLALILVDTLITAAGYTKTGDDNDQATAQRVMDALTGLSRHTGALVLGIDHFGKVMETGTRGSSAKEGHADVVLAMLADRELSGGVSNTRLAIRKMRDGLSGLEIPFTARTVEIGTDDDGEPITRVVIDWASPQQQTVVAKPWSKSLQLLRRVLMAAVVDGQDVRPFANGPVVRACDIRVIRSEFDKQYPADGTERQKADARRKAFTRAITDAQANNLIAIREIDGTQFVWLTQPG